MALCGAGDRGHDERGTEDSRSSCLHSWGEELSRMHRLVAALLARLRRRREPTDVELLVERYRREQP